MSSDERILNRKMKAESSAQVIASNDDLLTELLLCLPVKSLLRFKSVSKHWLSLISDPHFADRKCLESNAVSALYLDCYSPLHGVDHYSVVPLDPSVTLVAMEHLDFAGNPRRLKIEQSCNGLLLCRMVRENIYLVYNPTTKQSKTLPPLPPVLAGAEMRVLRPILAFDPSESRFFKVVHILRSQSDSDDSCQIVIYSSETGLWRVSGAPFIQPLPNIWTGVHCNGAIHWVGRTDALYCDLNEEVVRELPMPPPLSNYCYESHRYVGESGGRLYLVDSYEHLTVRLDVFEMEIDRSGWSLKFRVDRGMMASFTMPRIHLRSVLYVAGGETEEEAFMVLYMSNDRIIRYNFLSQTHREIYEIYFPMDDPIEVPPPASQYIESLSLV